MVRLAVIDEDDVALLADLLHAMGKTRKAAEPFGNPRGGDPYCPPGAVGGAGILPIVTSAQRIETAQIETRQALARLALLEHAIRSADAVGQGPEHREGNMGRASRQRLGDGGGPVVVERAERDIAGGLAGHTTG